jgi:putative transposase
MGRPYSMDLRERVIAAVATQGLSCHEAAARFGVGVSTAIRWMQMVRRTGNATPGKMGGHRPKKLIGPHRAWLVARCTGQSFTLRGLAQELAERGLAVDYRAVWAFVHAEKLSFKKKRWSPSNGIVRTSRGGEGNGKFISR